MASQAIGSRLGGNNVISPCIAYALSFHHFNSLSGKGVNWIIASWWSFKSEVSELPEFKSEIAFFPHLIC